MTTTPSRTTTQNVILGVEIFCHVFSKFILPIVFTCYKTMPFTLTKEYIDSILGPAAHGNWVPFVEAIDPNVHWIVNDPKYDSTSLTGTYVHLLISSPSIFWHDEQNLEAWQATIAGPLFAKLVDAKQTMKIDEVDIVGNKVIIESRGAAIQKNGKPYNNRWVRIAMLLAQLTWEGSFGYCFSMRLERLWRLGSIWIRL